MKASSGTIAVLTSGGDAPGMNACVRAIVRAAACQSWRVLGIHHGYQGLMEGLATPLHLGSVGNIIQRGGTILGSSRSAEFRTRQGRAQAFEFLKAQRVDVLMTLGGDGTFKGADLLSREHPIKVIGVPCTIDNDIAGTDLSIGYDTAVNTAVECIDRIRDTADSHGRVFVIEVMGKNSGHLALETALAAGAEFVIVPEKKYNAAELVQKIQRGIDRGKTGSIVIVAENERPGRALQIAQEIQKKIKRDVRAAILGHLQRGGSPSSRDRNLASRLGVAAVEFAVKGKNRILVGIDKGQVGARPLSVGMKKRRMAHLEDLRLIETLSI
jgi:6-phosphofructokinase 1